MPSIGEYYHVYNRGADEMPIFSEPSDYLHFIHLLLVANDLMPLDRRWTRRDIWLPYRKSKLVSIFAYCLMPDHFHLGLMKKASDGINKFIHKLCTAYTMFYNFKYKHSGTIFQGSSKTKHVNEDSYLMYLIQYIHLNPFGIEDPNLLKSAKGDYLNEAIEFSKKYKFSSYKDYLGEKRPQNIIVDVLPLSPVNNAF